MYLLKYFFKSTVDSMVKGAVMNPTGLSDLNLSNKFTSFFFWQPTFHHLLFLTQHVMSSAQLLLSRHNTPMYLWQYLVILTMLYSLPHFQCFNSLSAAQRHQRCVVRDDEDHKLQVEEN
ncbi:hypothetical protein XENOCAPTIV_029034 [Xenoophorus captivus]|uniref:Uncharacterized protein n=1 Tax=Xenoophorus captivus TaxID=1517983 RepID=A0ABV0QG25_9TELE